MKKVLLLTVGLICGAVSAGAAQEPYDQDYPPLPGVQAQGNAAQALVGWNDPAALARVMQQPDYATEEIELAENYTLRNNEMIQGARVCHEVYDPEGYPTLLQFAWAKKSLTQWELSVSDVDNVIQVLHRQNPYEITINFEDREGEMVPVSIEDWVGGVPNLVLRSYGSQGQVNFQQDIRLDLGGLSLSPEAFDFPIYQDGQLKPSLQRLLNGHQAPVLDQYQAAQA